MSVVVVFVVFVVFIAGPTDINSLSGFVEQILHSQFSDQ